MSKRSAEHQDLKAKTEQEQLVLKGKVMELLCFSFETVSNLKIKLDDVDSIKCRCERYA